MPQPRLPPTKQQRSPATLEIAPEAADDIEVIAADTSTAVVDEATDVVEPEVEAVAATSTSEADEADAKTASDNETVEQPA